MRVLKYILQVDMESGLGNGLLVPLITISTTENLIITLDYTLHSGISGWGQKALINGVMILL